MTALAIRTGPFAANPLAYDGPAIVVAPDDEEIQVRAELQIEVETVSDGSRRDHARYSWRGIVYEYEPGSGLHPLLVRVWRDRATLRMPDGRAATIYVMGASRYLGGPLRMVVIGVGPAPFGEIQ